MSIQEHAIFYIILKYLHNFKEINITNRNALTK